MDSVLDAETLPLVQSADRTWSLHEKITSSAEPGDPFSTSPLEIATDDESNASSRILSNPSSIGFNSVKEVSLSRSPSRQYKASVDTILDKLIVAAALMAWYGISVFSIVTSKILVQTWNCPPIVLTIQQLILGTILLRIVLFIRDGAIQPWPWDMTSAGIPISAINNTAAMEETTMEHELLLDRMKRQMPWFKHRNFVLSGIFNACDFLATNFAFSLSSAHFVETIKASEPITTTAIALFWKVDGLSMMEATSLSVLITGVILSTWGNSTDEQHMIADEQKLWESVRTASLAILANVNFGFRAINQKKYRSTTHETEQLDDFNFLCRMMQVGAIFLLLPTLLLNFNTLGRALHAPGDLQLTYIGLSMINSVSYVTYNLASCYVLSKLTVLQHSSLNCLRRMIAILATSVYFRKALTVEAFIGLILSFSAFSSFTYFRNQRIKDLKVKDSNV